VDTIEKIRKDAEEISGSLSDRVRVISVAILGLCWTFIIANLTSNTQAGAGLIDIKKLIFPLLFSVITLFLDFFHYLLNHVSINIYIDEIRSSIRRTGEFPNLKYGDVNPLIYYLARIAFWLKIIFMIAAVISFSSVIIPIVTK
jgi:hypothetical protein